MGFQDGASCRRSLMSMMFTLVVFVFTNHNYCSFLGEYFKRSLYFKVQLSDVLNEVQYRIWTCTPLVLWKWSRLEVTRGIFESGWVKSQEGPDEEEEASSTLIRMQNWIRFTSISICPLLSVAFQQAWSKCAGITLLDPALLFNIFLLVERPGAG